MSYSFAAQVRAQLPCIRHRLGEERPRAGAAAPSLVLTHYESLSEHLTADTLPAWLDLMRALGAQVADAAGAVEGLIAEAVSFHRRLRECVVEDMPGGVPDDPRMAADLEGLEAALITALLGGYVAARERDLAQQKEELDIANALHEVNSAANSTLELATVLAKTVRAIVDVSAADVCSIFIYEPELDRLVLRATQGLTSSAVGQVLLRRGEGISGAAAELGRPIAVRSARSDPRNVAMPEFGEDAYRSILAVPIVLYAAKPKLVGVITVESRTEREFGQREVNFLETVAGEIAIAIENARLYQQTDSRLRQKVQELETLQGFSATLAETLDLRQVLNLLASQAVRLIEAEAAVVYERHQERLEPVASYHVATAGLPGMGRPALTPPPAAPAADAMELPTLHAHDSVLSRAILLGQPIGLHRLPGGDGRAWASDHPAVSAEAIAADPAIRASPYNTIFCVPLNAPRGVVGAICLYSQMARPLHPEQVALLNAFAREGALAVENARLYEKALHGLEVKTWLMREMNHRVRNNLARAVSLLQMQQRRLNDDSAATKALGDSIVRMESIARVHDLLSREEIGTTSVADLIGLAVEVVSKTLGRPDLHVEWQIEAPPIAINSPTAFPLLLAIVELLSNTLLHGFAGRDEGRVHITAHAPDGWVQLVVTDNGAGLPPLFDMVRDADLGLLIVRLLIQSELKGTIRLDPADTGGVAATITFKPALAEAEA